MYTLYDLLTLYLSLEKLQEYSWHKIKIQKEWKITQVNINSKIDK